MGEPRPEILSEQFQQASTKIAEIIAGSKTPEDPTHSMNVREWLLKLQPDADEIQQLAALGHDIERAMPDRLKPEDFPEDYDAYKKAHAQRAGQILSQIVEEAGYGKESAERIAQLVAEAEFSSEDPDIQTLSDADSISYFDNNLPFYVGRNGHGKKTKDKIRFMFDRCSPRAQAEIRKLMESRSDLRDLFHEAISSVN